MKTIKKVAGVLCIALFLLVTGCGDQAGNGSDTDLRIPDEAFLKYGEEYTDIVELARINDSVWVHTSYYEIGGVLRPHNGLVVLTNSGLVLVNAPWTGNQMDSLDKLVIEQFNSRFTDAIVTDVAAEYTGGLRCLKKKDIRLTCLDRVAQNVVEIGLIEPDTVLDGDEACITYGDVDFEIFFPGAGYSDNNTIVWIDEYNLLYAGNLVKEYGASSLGNSRVSRAWPDSLTNILSRYDSIEIVVPGRGQWGDASLIDYTWGYLKNKALCTEIRGGKMKKKSLLAVYILLSA